MENEIDKKNTDIKEQLKCDELNITVLNELIEQRHQLIVDHLASLDEAEAKIFAEKELNIQKEFQSHFQTLLTGYKSEFSKFLTSRKLAAKYK
jgi:polysaccharide pyruvyl transferase WcaK-like protein